MFWRSQTSCDVIYIYPRSIVVIINSTKLKLGTNTYASAWKIVGILRFLSLVATIVMYADTMPAIPNLKDFKITYKSSSWILTAYLPIGAIMTPNAGKHSLLDSTTPYLNGETC
jgi:hypothetical protein